MEAPTQINPRGPGDYLEVMSMMVFQSGMSWKVVKAKWPGIREAFHGFDAARVADMTEADIDRLAADTRVIRNRRKLAAIVENANTILDLEAKHGDFRDYVRSHGDFEATVKALRKDFKFLGATGSHMFLHIIGEETPPCEEWAHARGRRTAVAR